MQATKIIHQRPCPKIEILAPDDGTVKLTFHPSDVSSIQSFNFSLSNDDITGSFNLLFFPENKGESLFDQIDLLDIVQIYEDYPVVTRAYGDTKITTNPRPVFTGIIRSKKYAATSGDSGAMRRMSVSGTAITGLVSQFKVSLDVTAQSVRGLADTNEEINAGLVTKNLAETKIKDIILNVWTAFLNLSAKTGTPTIAEYITRFMKAPATFFDVEGLSVGYPLAAIFAQEQTQDFFSIIENILPSPYYEKTAYTDSSGLMKIRIRKCPFDADDWKALNKITIDGKRVKSFDITQSDNEVYTVFLAYLEGSPMSEHEYMIIGINEAKDNDYLETDNSKFGKYGYRPLFVHFRGYKPPDDGNDATSSDKMKEATQQIASWFGNLDKMLSGTITLAMTYNNPTNRIMPGDVVEFLGGQFYVDGIAHSWTYNGGGEISISVSRGGIYDENGDWSQFKDTTGKSSLLSSTKKTTSATSEADTSVVIGYMARGLNR